LIPAMHVSKDGKISASIQVITGDHAWWQEYTYSLFSASRNSLCIKIGDNVFSEAGLVLNIEREGLSLHGRLKFGSFHSLKSDIMGPFGLVANMECAHCVISMRHTLEGKLELNGDVLDFCGGAGYIEGDRGRSFPSAYLWTQCMWENCSLMLSAARIPIGKIHFTGCICAMILNGQEYRFATYHGARIQNWSSKGAVLRQGKYLLEVKLLEQNPQKLRAPSDGAMNRTVHESLCAKVRYRFRKAGELLFDHTDEYAGFEWANIS